jgi:hypothetical protein
MTRYLLVEAKNYKFILAVAMIQYKEMAQPQFFTEMTVMMSKDLKAGKPKQTASV